jgi:anthranilate synthase/aminodeoxychorismate synthase-like glutamine amidotransferase
MILMIDNYDSFTYNLVQYLGQLGEDVTVHRNDSITPAMIEDLEPEAIFLSPGPRSPKDAGCMVDIIRQFYQTIPIMGICLGHQAIGYAFGARVVQAPTIMHGKTSEIYSDGETIFKRLPTPFVAARYHSLILDRASIPAELEISAETGQKEIMGIRHRKYPVEGIQFHPESILTPHGKRIIGNFLAMARNSAKN